MHGGAGDAAYLFGRGDGRDAINNTGEGHDLLSFMDIDSTELWFGRPATIWSSA